MSTAAETGSRPIALHSGRIELDGQPSLLLSGEVHYFRLAREEWAGRLTQVRDAGLDTVASYIPWLWHELPDGEIDLVGRTRPERDLAGFIDLCDSFGLRFIARPGPFVMAELKNEGLPYRVYREHPDARPVGWDGQPALSSDLDYHHPGYRAAAEGWLEQVFGVLAGRQAPDGPVIAVQLDNEVGMLAWVSNTPHLDDHAAADFWSWLTDRLGNAAAAELLDLTEADHDRSVIAPAMRRGGDRDRTLAFHHQLGIWARERFAGYLQRLELLARDHRIDVPLLINVHGCGGGRGHTFPIGVSQLAQAYRGRAGVLAGSDYYFGELAVGNVADLYLCNAIMACVNGPDQPASSLEFEVGTGDYGDNLDALSSPESGVNKTLMTIGQGNRLINYYLLAGGRNPLLDEPTDDGIPRIAFTGGRHGFAAPIDPEGVPTPAIEALTKMIKEVRDAEAILASGRQLTDDLGYGFVADHYLTEYAHPGSEARRDQVTDLVRHRGFGFRDALGRALVLGGYSFGAVDVQALAEPDSPWAAGVRPPEPPRTIVLSTPRTLAASVQQWLVDHVRGGGRLLLTGELPDRDHHGNPCTILGDAFGLTSAGVRTGQRDESGPYWPTVTGTEAFPTVADLGVGSAQLLQMPTEAEILLREIGSGLPCAVQTELGAGSMIFLGCDLPAAQLDTWRSLLSRLRVERRVRTAADRPGLVAVPVSSEAGNLLIVINVAPYPITTSISVDGSVITASTTIPARGHTMLAW